MKSDTSFSESTSSIRVLFKVVLWIFSVALISIGAFLFMLPSLLSSDFSRKKIEVYLSEDLQRSVSINTLTYSWKEGFVASDFTLYNKDSSPLLVLHDLRLLFSWPSLAAGNLTVHYLGLNNVELTLIRDKSGRLNISDLLESETSFPLLSLEAHVKEGKVTFIDNRLGTVTRIQNLQSDLSMLSLTEPIDFSLKGDIKDLKINADVLEGYPFRSKSLSIAPDVLIDFSQSKVKVTSLSVNSDIATAKVWGTLDGESNISMEGTLSSSLSRLKEVFSGVLPPSFPHQGQLSSDLTLTGNLNKALSVKGTHTIDGAKVTLLSSPDEKPTSSPHTISFPEITVAHDVVYTDEQDTLNLKSLKANAPFFNFEGSGSFSQLSKNLLTHCQGKASFNMSEAQRLLGPLMTEGFSSNGRGKLTFDCKGSLFPPDEKPLLASLNGNGSFFVESITYPDIGVIQNLHSTKLLLKKGILNSTLKCLLNNGPCQLRGTIDFNKKEPLAKVAIEAHEVVISKKIKILGYIVPILNVPPSGLLSGKGDFSTKASWEGMDWNSQISKTILGEGKLIVNDGIVKGENVLSEILKVFGKPSSFQFEQIKTDFILKEGKVYNGNILLDGKDMDFSFKGWTSLSYDPVQKGNPVEYSVTGDFLKKYINKDTEDVLSIFGGGKPVVPVVITGTIQKPKVSIKKPGMKDILQGIINSPLLQKK